MKGSSSHVSVLTPRRLEGKVALITDGASGIGENTARVFTRYGAKVVIADIQDDLGNTICKDINDQQSFCYIHCDVSREFDIQSAIDFITANHGRLDIIFNNAGVADKPSLNVLEMDFEDFQRVLDVNIYGSFLGAKHVARVMILAKKGVILFTVIVAT